MAKKSFRVQSGSPEAPAPTYPRLSELGPAALRRWGLAALGSLAVAGAGCWRTAGVPAPTKPVENVQIVPPDAAPVPPPEYPPPTGGVPPPVRIEDQGASRQSGRSGRPDKPERRKGQSKQAAAAKRGIK
jgi:hypothetical protein